MSRLGRLVRHPDGSARWLAIVTWLYVAWSLIPVLVAVRISFNDGRSRSTFQPVSWRWYWGDQQSSVWHDETLRTAMKNSLQLASLTMLKYCVFWVGPSQRPQPASKSS